MLSGLKLCNLVFVVRDIDIGLSEDIGACSASTASPATESVDPVCDLPQNTTLPSLARACSPGLPGDSTAGLEDDPMPLSSMNLAERTLDAFNVVAFVNGLLAFIPALTERLRWGRAAGKVRRESAACAWRLGARRTTCSMKCIRCP